MRNFLTIICLALTVCFSCANNAQAQSQTVSKKFRVYSDNVLKTAAQKTMDTATNGNAKAQVAYIPGFFNTVSIQVQMRRLSGTLAGKLYFLGAVTNDANAFEKVDSLTLVNVANQVKIFNVTPSKYVYYKVQLAPTGTNSTEFKSLAVARKN